RPRVWAAVSRVPSWHGRDRGFDPGRSFRRVSRRYAQSRTRVTTTTGSTPMRKMTGSCLCGQVHYSAEAEPMFTAVCHCRNCQKQAGTAFTIVVAVPRTAFTVTGRMKTFHDTGDSGQPVERHFCPECGSPIFSDVAVMPGVAFIKAGTLDDTTWL